MCYFQWQPLLIFIILSTSFSPSHEASHHSCPNVQCTKHPISYGSSLYHHRSTKRIQGVVNDNVVSWRRERSLVDDGKAEDKSSLLLAVNRTKRKDPSNNFEYYTGGWNISNKHYLWIESYWKNDKNMPYTITLFQDGGVYFVNDKKSVGYSAIGPFIVSGVWTLGFGVFLLVLSICRCCCSRKIGGFSDVVYTILLVILLVVTVDTMIGSGILFRGQGRFHTRTSKVLNYIMDQANTTSEKLKIVYNQLSTAKQVAMDQKVSLPPEILDNVDNVLKDINSSVTLLDGNKDDIARHIKYTLDQVILSLIIISTFMLVFTLLGLLLSFLGLQIPLYLFLFIGWILVAGLFILCGIFLLFHNAVGDTCLAMNQWVENPTAQTALDDLLSCPDNATSEQALTTTKNVTVKLLSNVNQFVLLAGNANFPPEPPPKAGSMNFNQSGPLMPPVCVPFNGDLSDRKCADGEVELANVTELYGTFVCKASGDGICTSKGRMTPDIYAQISLATNVSYTLNHYGPFLVDLMDCSFVRETFSLISKEHCPEVSLYSNWIYIGLSMVASGVMLSVLLWGPYAQR